MPRKMSREPKTSIAANGSAPISTQPIDRSAKPSKIDQVRALLLRQDGATLAELVEATGWLPHTARAALTGLRKKGAVIEKSRRGDATCYRIAGAAQ